MGSALARSHQRPSFAQDTLLGVLVRVRDAGHWIDTGLYRALFSADVDKSLARQSNPSQIVRRGATPVTSWDRQHPREDPWSFCGPIPGR